MILMVLLVMKIMMFLLQPPFALWQEQRIPVQRHGSPQHTFIIIRVIVIVITIIDILIATPSCLFDYYSRPLHCHMCWSHLLNLTTCHLDEDEQPS